MTLISCENLTVKYEQVNAVDNISFDINEGDFISVVGENGSGKSTLIKAILGLTPISGGKIGLGGISQKEIGYLPQQTPAQRDFPATVTEIVRSGFLPSMNGRFYYSVKEKQAADDAIKLLRLTDLKKRCYRELSGGQQQRVLLARAFCAANKLILLDEPATGLDPVMTTEFYSILETLNRERKMAVVMVSHDICSVIGYSNKILHMESSGRYFFGTSENYMETPYYQSLHREQHNFGGEGE